LDAIPHLRESQPSCSFQAAPASKASAANFPAAIRTLRRHALARKAGLCLTLGDDKRNVIVLFTRAELLNVSDNRGQQILGVQLPVPT
jgi:hypothetical protein